MCGHAFYLFYCLTNTPLTERGLFFYGVGPEDKLPPLLQIHPAGDAALAAATDDVLRSPGFPVPEGRHKAGMRDDRFIPIKRRVRSVDRPEAARAAECAAAWQIPARRHPRPARRQI